MIRETTLTFTISGNSGVEAAFNRSAQRVERGLELTGDCKMYYNRPFMGHS